MLLVSSMYSIGIQHLDKFFMSNALYFYTIWHEKSLKFSHKVCSLSVPKLHTLHFKPHQNENKTYFLEISTREIHDIAGSIHNQDMLLRFGKSGCLVVDLFETPIWDNNLEELGLTLLNSSDLLCSVSI